MKPSRYRSIKVVAEDGVFDSRKELKRWNDLLILERAGEITDLTRDKLDCTFRMVVNGILVCKYQADARYKENGEWVTEDTKSEITRKDRVYRIKVKLLKAIYGIDIREV